MEQGMRGYKLCKECGQPLLKNGQKRKHHDDYRHAGGCRSSVSAVRVIFNQGGGRPFAADINGKLLRKGGRGCRFATEEAAVQAGLEYLAKKYPVINIKRIWEKAINAQRRR